MDKVRVIQWTTGKVGGLTLKSVLQDPQLELVGLFAYSPDKVGIDAGELCGLPACGVKATNDIDALIALKADTVLYTPFMADLDHLVRLLESGADVISSNLLFNLGGVDGAVKEQLDAACQRGGSSFYITGINPGWINSVAVALTGACNKVDFVGISEAADCTVYESPETWSTFGMGQAEAGPEVLAAAKAWLTLFRDVVVRIGDALELTFDDIEFFVEYASAAERVDLGWFCMEKGTNAAVRGGWNGMIGGRPVVQAKITWFLSRNLSPAWEIDDDLYRIAIKGEPDLDVSIGVHSPSYWSNNDRNSTTSMPMINVIYDVMNARPGVLGLRDVGLPYAPAGRRLA